MIKKGEKEKNGIAKAQSYDEYFIQYNLIAPILPFFLPIKIKKSLFDSDNINIFPACYLSLKLKRKPTRAKRGAATVRLGVKPMS